MFQKVKYWYEEPDLSMEETPVKQKKTNLKSIDSENNSSSEEENHEEEESEEEICEYEKLRLKNVEENRQLLM